MPAGAVPVVRVMTASASAGFKYVSSYCRAKRKKDGGENADNGGAFKKGENQ